MKVGWPIKTILYKIQYVRKFILYNYMHIVTGTNVKFSYNVLKCNWYRVDSEINCAFVQTIRSALSCIFSYNVILWQDFLTSAPVNMMPL